MPKKFLILIGKICEIFKKLSKIQKIKQNLIKLKKNPIKLHAKYPFKNGQLSK